MYKLIINFKTYDSSFDKNALKIMKICEDLKKDARKKKVEIIIVPNILDLKEISKIYSKTFAQHIDNLEQGAHTGHLIPSQMAQIKIKGILINHSEDRTKFDNITSLIEKTRELNIKTCFCVENLNEVKLIEELKPDFIAIEPKELIGGNISISTANPKLIEKAVKQAKNIPILVGAGVKTKEDVKIAIRLGAKGILVASGIILAKDIELAIRNLIEGF